MYVSEINTTRNKTEMYWARTNENVHLIGKEQCNAAVLGIFGLFFKLGIPKQYDRACRVIAAWVNRHGIFSKVTMVHGWMNLDTRFSLNNVRVLHVEILGCMFNIIRFHGQYYRY